MDKVTSGFKQSPKLQEQKTDRQKEAMIVNLYHRVTNLNLIETQYKVLKKSENRGFRFTRNFIHVPSMEKIMAVLATLLIWKKSKFIRIHISEDHWFFRIFWGYQ